MIGVIRRFTLSYQESIFINVMNSFKVPFTRINFSLFHHAVVNIWGEDCIRGVVWSFHLFPAKHFWKWGNKRRIGVAHYVHDIGFGPIFRLTKIISKEK